MLGVLLLGVLLLGVLLLGILLLGVLLLGILVLGILVLGILVLGVLVLVREHPHVLPAHVFALFVAKRTRRAPIFARPALANNHCDTA